MAPGSVMNFFVVGKRVVLPDRDMEQAGVGPERQRFELHTHTAISCPPRSLTGLGSDLLAKTTDVDTLMELETTSSGGLLRALSGTVVWRTTGDFRRLVLQVVRARFADGRFVWEVLPRLVVPLDGPVAQVVKAEGKLKKLTNDMLTDIRDYVKRLVEAAERNQLPLCLLHLLISFLGSPPGEATGSPPAQQPPPMAVWQTMTQLGSRRLDSGLGGHARKRHHTSECAGVPETPVAGPPRRRQLTSPADPGGCLLQHCDELWPLPAAADHPLDQHLADRTVRFCSRPGAVVWQGCELGRRWRRELATQLRCRIVGRLTLITFSRGELNKETRQRCLKHDLKRMLWKRAHDHKKLLRQLQRRPNQEPEQEEKPERLPYPFQNHSTMVGLLHITPQPLKLGNNMLVFPPLLKERKRSKVAQRRQPKFKFEPSQRFSLKLQKSFEGMQSKQPHEQPRAKDSVGTTSAQVHRTDTDGKHQSPVQSAPTPKQKRIKGRPSPHAVGSSETNPSKRSLAGEGTRKSNQTESDRRPVPLLTLDHHRFKLLDAHYEVIQQGRRPRRKVEKPLPPRSPLAGPAPPEQPPPRPQAAPSVRPQTIRPSLWMMRLMGPLPLPFEEPYPCTPQNRERRQSSHNHATQSFPAQIQKATISPSLNLGKQAYSQQVRDSRPSPSRAQRKRPSPSHIHQKVRSSPPQTQQKARLSPRQTRQVVVRSPPSPSLWDRVASSLGLSRPEEPLEEVEVEVGQEATEACVSAIVRYQSTLPPLWRGRLLDGGC